MAYNHCVKRVHADCYRISWTIDGKVKGSRLRYPRTTARMTDANGAQRFVLKWKLTLHADLATQLAADLRAVAWQ